MEILRLVGMVIALGAASGVAFTPVCNAVCWWSAHT